MPSSPWCFSMCPPVHWLMMASSAKADGTDGHAVSASPSKLPKILAKSSVVSKSHDLDRYTTSPGYGEGLQKLSLEGSRRVTAGNCEDQGDHQQARSSSSASSSCRLSSSERLVVSTKKRRDEDDRYPCLRRALSCTETPILPLGTYALEFGFDVTCLPFAGFIAASNNMTVSLQDARQLPRNTQQPLNMASVPVKEANNTASMWPAPYSDRSQCSLGSDEETGGSLSVTCAQNNLSASARRHATLRSSLNQPGKVHGHNVCSNRDDTESHVDQRKERTVQQRKYNQRRRRSPRKEAASDNRRNTANYFLTENTRLSEIEEELSPVSSGDGGNGNNGLQGEKPEETDSGKLRANTDKSTANLSSSDSAQRDDFASEDRKYASVYKKDSRTWLWKSSAKKSSGETDNELALKWKKDNRKWLWKSSWKKETSRSRISDDRSS